MVESAFYSFSLILFVALILAVLVQLIRQPPIIAYILAGIFVGPFFLQLTEQIELVELFAHLGVAFLLFVVGLNLNYTRIKEIGKVVLVTGIAQVVLTSFLGYIVALLFGFNNTEALYIGVALTFSSTIIVVKLLADKGDLDTLYGRMSLGILLVQDLVVIIIMTGLSTFLEQQDIPSLLFTLIFKVGLLLLALWLISKYLLPRILNFLAKSMDLLFLFSISWAVLLGALLSYLGFSMEIGALLAGIALSTSQYQLEISYRVKLLRDFFIIVFFIWLGIQMNISSALMLLLPVLIISLFIFIVKPLIIMLILKHLNYTNRVGFYTGSALSQISEFSIVFIIFGRDLGHITQDSVSLITLIALITIIGSTYMIKYNSVLYEWLKPRLKFFEPKKSLNQIKQYKKSAKQYTVILFGHNRIGFSLGKAMLKKKKKFLIIDYNPDIINHLQKNKIPCIYGDAGNVELLENIGLAKVRMIISTLPDVHTNLLIIDKVRSVNKKAIIITTAHLINQAILLYNAGAHYVILPHFLGGRHVATLIENYGFNAERFIKEKLRQLDELSHRKNLGHEHPANT